MSARAAPRGSILSVMVERHLWRDWVAANAFGEVAGLGVAVVIAIGVAQRHAIPPAAEILLVTAAFLAIGAYEGAIVGAAQWLVLRRVIPSLRAKEWIGATAVGAIVAWTLGRIPSGLADWSPAAGAALGVILGAAQWVVLRGHVKRAGIWIGANALAWTAGMPLIFLAAGLPSPHTSALAIGAFVTITVAVAGAVVGAIEGAFLRLLLRAAG